MRSSDQSVIFFKTDMYTYKKGVQIFTRYIMRYLIPFWKLIDFFHTIPITKGMISNKMTEISGSHAY